MTEQARALWQEKLELLLAEEAKAFDPAAKFKILQDIADARAKLSELAPAAKPEPEPDPPIEPKWTDELRIYGEGFVGRQDELAALDRAWAAGARIFALHAEGGAGKTRVVVEWLRRMRDAGWRGARRVFVHSFYSQGSDERRNATSELFFEQALAYFGYQGAPILQADEKGRTLARLLVEHHGLLVLDGLEPLQHPTQHAEKGRLKDPGIARLLLSLASVAPGETSGLCLITSRQPVIELQERTGATVLQQSLDHLHRDDGALLLRQFQVAGPDEELKKASDEFRGHAYSLMLLGSYLKTATDHHDIRRRREVLLLDEDPEHGNHARHMFAAYVEHLGDHSPEVAVLRLLGFFDRAAEREFLDVLRAREGVVYEWSGRQSQPKRIEDALPEMTAPLVDLPQAHWHRVLNRLRDLRLIDFTGPEKSPSLDAHPLLRECFAEQVRTQFPAAWQDGHRRLFEHLGGTAPYWPEGIEGLQPLYQAVAHGCLAGLHEQACADVYRDRILRGTRNDGFYSWKMLGAVGADLGVVACFFTTPWTTLAPTFAPAAQAWLLGMAAFYLRALVRLSEAAEPLRSGLDMHVQEENWKAAANDANNLSELELTRGEVAAAVTSGDQAVTFADRSGDAFEQMAGRARLADALHQVGRRDESRRLFEGAESRQAERQPEYPQLYSLQGFLYCDLLLSDVERAAWRRWLGAEIGPIEMLTKTTAACYVVIERASKTLAWVTPQNWLLAIALDHLTLAQATLYIGQPARDHIEATVNGLRAAGQLDYLPFGLLTRAWQHCLSGDEAGARADLDEAWEIAERGPMPLFQADIQLTRARLFRDRAALAEARRLIEKHGYHRRDEELADAEAAADGPLPWPLPRGAGEGNPPPKAPTDQVVCKTRNEDVMRDQVFISYSHEDEKLMKELLKHLKPFSRSGSVTVWADKQIAPGSKWFDDIKAALAKSSAAVLLVSPDFLASDFIHEHELGPLLKEAEAGGVTILWVPLRPSAYEETPLKSYQAVSPPHEPLSQMSKAGRDEAWVRICKEIKAAVNP